MQKATANIRKKTYEFTGRKTKIVYWVVTNGSNVRGLGIL